MRGRYGLLLEMPRTSLSSRDSSSNLRLRHSSRNLEASLVSLSGGGGGGGGGGSGGSSPVCSLCISSAVRRSAAFSSSSFAISHSARYSFSFHSRDSGPFFLSDRFFFLKGGGVWY